MVNVYVVLVILAFLPLHTSPASPWSVQPPERWKRPATPSPLSPLLHAQSLHFLKFKCIFGPLTLRPALRCSQGLLLCPPSLDFAIFDLPSPPGVCPQSRGVHFRRNTLKKDELEKPAHERKFSPSSGILWLERH